MKLEKRGRHRNCGRTKLAEHDLTKNVSGAWYPVEWDGEAKSLKIEVAGRDNSSSYRYTISLTVPEIAKLVGVMFANDLNTAIRAHAKGFSAFIEEAYREPKNA